MASEAAAGSQTAVITTEHTLSTQSSAGVFVLLVDLTNMAGGDVLELRVKAKARSAEASAKVAYFATYANAQGIPIAVSVPIAATYAVFTLKQTAGTGRAYPWSVVSL